MSSGQLLAQPRSSSNGVQESANKSAASEASLDYVSFQVVIKSAFFLQFLAVLAAPQKNKILDSVKFQEMDQNG